MSEKRIKFLLRELGFAILQILFSRVNLLGFISPSGLTFAFARLFFDANIIFVTLEYLVSQIWTFFNIRGVIICIYEIVLLTLYYFAKEFVKIKRKKLLLSAFLVVANALPLYYAMFNLTTLWQFAVNFGLQIIVLLYFYKLFTAYKNKFIFFKFSHLDYLYFSVAVFLLSAGMFGYGLILKYFSLFLISSLTVALCRILPVDKFFVSCCVFALGAVVVSGNYFFVVLSAISSLLIFQFKDLNKYVYGLTCLAAFLALALCFRLFDAVSLTSLAAAVAVFAVTPNKIFVKLKSLFELEDRQILAATYEQSKTKKIQGKLILMSGALASMNSSLKYLLVGKIDRKKACRELAGDVIDRCCGNCEFFKSCFLGNIDKRALIENLLLKAIEMHIEGKDLTNGTMAYCSKNQIILSEVNQTAKLYLSYEHAMKTEDESKLLIASEIQNFSDIFLNFAKLIDGAPKVNQKLSKALQEALFNNLIDAKEVQILESQFGITSISLVLTNEQALRREVLQSIYAVTKLKVKMSETKHLDYSGICMAVFVPVGSIRPEFAVSTKAKEETNGDNAIICKLDENKFFVAIADGMGHGESANKISMMVLSLIRSLFEVGLDDELIISSINKLLLPVGLDNFTTLDACVVDFEKQTATFIKLGSSVSVLKHRETSETIVCESLPIGIVQNVKPTIVTRPISSGDMIFLASDGIVDSFQSVEIFKSFINDAKIYNLQKYLDEVVYDAWCQNKEHRDDMTIIGVNLLKNS